MRSLSKLLLSICLFSWLHSNAQEKYAVIVGINDYYIKPGVKYSGSLQGCVNDARAIKKLLLNRFGFREANIQTLYNAEATRSRVLDLMRQTLKSCKPGDVFVFYYSGHGAWMSNQYEMDTVKKKMSQAMVMSDLYAPNLDCLLTDEDAKKVYNEFIDKKVVVTDLLDCCFSGNMRMAFLPKLWTPVPMDMDGRLDLKSLNLHDISYIIDSNGVKASMPADEYIRDYGDEDPHFVDTSLSANDIATSPADRSFNMKDALHVNYKPTERRPSERVNSRFLTLSASTDREKASEIIDETGTPHGAFTKALLTVYKKNPAGLPVSALLNKITEVIKQQKYSHTPTYHFDSSRLARNLLGIGESGFSNTITATCTGVKGTVVTLDKGLDDGIGKGNIFKGTKGNQVLQVKAVDSTSALATLKSGSVKKGQAFRLTNNSILSAPLVKLYIPEVPMTPAQYDAFFQTKVRPFLSMKFGLDDATRMYYGLAYADFHSPMSGFVRKVIEYDNAVQHHDVPTPRIVDSSSSWWVVVFLPLPSFVTTALKEKVKQHQNIELVNSIEKADFVLYLNYAKATKKKPASFGFFYHPCLDHPGKPVPPVFSVDVVETERLQLSGSKRLELLKQLYALSRRAIRYKSLVWINDDPKP